MVTFGVWISAFTLELELECSSGFYFLGRLREGSSFTSQDEVTLFKHISIYFCENKLQMQVTTQQCRESWAVRGFFFSSWVCTGIAACKKQGPVAEKKSCRVKLSLCKWEHSQPPWCPVWHCYGSFTTSWIFMNKRGKVLFAEVHRSAVHLLSSLAVQFAFLNQNQRLHLVSCFEV